MGANGARASSAEPAILVDCAAMEDLRRAVGDEIFFDIFSDAQFDLSERLGRLEDLVANADFDRAGRLAHDVVSVAGSIGLLTLSDLASRLERACLADDCAAAGALAHRMARVGAASLAQAKALSDGFAHRGAAG